MCVLQRREKFNVDPTADDVSLDRVSSRFASLRKILSAHSAENSAPDQPDERDKRNVLHAREAGDRLIFFFFFFTYAEAMCVAVSFFFLFLFFVREDMYYYRSVVLAHLAVITVTLRL